MTPRALHQYFRARERALERTEKAAWQRAIVQAFHTARFGMQKKLSGSDLKRVLSLFDQKGGKSPQTQRQLWALIQATHVAVSGTGKAKRKKGT